jgi:TolA-binding protein
MRLDRFTWLALPLLLAVLGIAQDAPKPAPAAPSLELTEAEKKDLTIANQALTILNQEFRLLQGRLTELREQYQKQEQARAAMLARIEKAKGPDVKCDAERLTCEKKPVQPAPSEGKK